MIRITEKSTCCGCTACASVCPKNAITMQADEEGFLYPQVDTARCVECGLCEVVCPLRQEPPAAPAACCAYAVQHADPHVLENSTSGGAFTALSDAVLSAGGSVYGATLDEKLAVVHRRATDGAGRDAMRGSKYVQSDLRGIFEQVKADLKDGKRVLFVGTPCQVDGLRRYLRGQEAGLLTCDLICHGTPSPAVLRAHFTLLEKKTHHRLKNYHWRPKRWGWHIHREMAVLDNGREYYSTPWADLWQQVYYGRLATRPSCHACPYASLARPGDITIGDCRGIDKVLPDFGSSVGASLVLVNTPAGTEAFEAIRQAVKAEPIDVQAVLQPPLRQCSKPASRRELFMRTFRERGYEEAVKVCFGRQYALKYYIKKLLKRG